MNPVVENLNAYRTGERFLSQEPIQFHEKYNDFLRNPYNTAAYVEYEFKASFGSVHHISEYALNDSKAGTLDYIKQEVAHKLTDALYGKYISQLHDIRIKCLASNRRDLAEDISKIINDIIET